MNGALILERDLNGALVHVRNRRTRECVGDIEAGLFEIVREIIRAEVLVELAKLAKLAELVKEKQA